MDWGGTFKFRLRYEKVNYPVKTMNECWELVESELTDKIWLGRVDIPFIDLTFV